MAPTGVPSKQRPAASHIISEVRLNENSRLETGNTLDSHLLLAQAEELVLLVQGLEAAVAELRRGVDELEGDLLDGAALGLLEERLAQRDDALLRADDAALGGVGWDVSGVAGVDVGGGRKGRPSASCS